MTTSYFYGNWQMFEIMPSIPNHLKKKKKRKKLLLIVLKNFLTFILNWIVTIIYVYLKDKSCKIDNWSLPSWKWQVGEVWVQRKVHHHVLSQPPIKYKDQMKTEWRSLEM